MKTVGGAVLFIALVLYALPCMSDPSLAEATDDEKECIRAGCCYSFHYESDWESWSDHGITPSAKEKNSFLDSIFQNLIKSMHDLFDVKISKRILRNIHRDRWQLKKLLGLQHDEELRNDVLFLSLEMLYPNSSGINVATERTIDVCSLFKDMDSQESDDPDEDSYEDTYPISVKTFKKDIRQPEGVLTLDLVFSRESLGFDELASTKLPFVRETRVIKMVRDPDSKRDRWMIVSEGRRNRMVRNVGEAPKKTN